MGRFQGRVCLVTGAARGQGRSHALAFAEEGADLILCDVLRPISSVPYPMGTRDQLDDTVKACERLGRQVLAMECDVRNEGAVADLVAKGIDRFGRIDVLLNNAGVVSLGQVDQITTDMWDAVVDTNLKGAWLLMKHVIPHMRTAGFGRIITTSSGTVNSPAANLAHYVASKHGVVGLTRVVAQEVGPSGITVNCVLPGNADTPMLEGVFDALGVAPEAGRAAFSRLQLDQALIKAEDVSDACLFLASDQASRINGISLTVDGGGSVMSAMGEAFQ